MTTSRQKFLRFTEYVTVSASIVGAIAAIVTRQLFYAVVPLSVSAALNLASRRQLEQHIEQRLAQNITQVDQLLESFRHQNLQIEERLNTWSQQQPDTGLARVEELQALRDEVTQLAGTLSRGIRTLQRELALQNRQEGGAIQEESLTTIAVKLQELETSISTEVQNVQDRLLGLDNQWSRGQVALEDAISLIRIDSKQLRRELNQVKNEFAAIRLLLRDIPSPSPGELSLPPSASDESVVPPAADEVRWIPPQLPSIEGFTLEINLGIDFGTGFTKVCFRDLASDRSEIVTFADSSDVELEQALLSTKIAILEDGTLLTGLSGAEWQSGSYPVKTFLEFIKMRLAHLDLPEESDWRLEKISDLDDSETVEHVCAYYLSRIITRSQEWIQKHRADLFKNQIARWSLNMGVPVEYCDSPALHRFQRVLSLAWLMANSPSSAEALTLPALNQFGVYLRRWMLQYLLVDLDCFTTPEISAAVWSFLSSRQAVEKFYTFFDFGDGTLDGTAFRFWRENNGELKVDFYTGQVRPLGVTAFTQQVASELEISSNEIVQALFEWQPEKGSGIFSEIQISRTRRQVQQLVASVVMNGKGRHRDNRGLLLAQDELGNRLDVFLGGGGGQNLFFQNTVQATYQDFQQGHAGVPEYRIQQIPAPEDLIMNGLNPNEFHRFAVAYGLCIPEWEGPEVRLPSQVEANVCAAPRRVGYRTLYEDTRDLM